MHGNEGCRSVYAIIEHTLTYNGFACKFSKSCFGNWFSQLWYQVETEICCLVRFEVKTFYLILTILWEGIRGERSGSRLIINIANYANRCETM